MPMIVVGGDTAPGAALLASLSPTEREIRVFVTDEARAAELKNAGFKVATGDVSDDSHVEAAATRCFSAVLIEEAARDLRERSFADTKEKVLRGWASAVGNSEVRRVIWVTSGDHPETKAPEVAVVDPDDPALVERIIELDEKASLD